MEFGVGTFLYLLTLHFIGDFILQSDRIATGKGKDGRILSEHVYIYTSTFLIGTIFVFGVAGACAYACFNGILHFATDFVTSKITAEFHARGDRHNFFVTIGADQLIHALCLGATLIWIM